MNDYKSTQVTSYGRGIYVRETGIPDVFHKVEIRGIWWPRQLESTIVFLKPPGHDTGLLTRVVIRLEDAIAVGEDVKHIYIEYSTMYVKRVLRNTCTAGEI